MNNMTSLVQCFGFPSPHLSSDTMEKIHKTFHHLQKESSVSDFDTLNKLIHETLSNREIKSDPNDDHHTPLDHNHDHENVNGSNNQLMKSNCIHQLRGNSLKELKKFFLQYDPNETFCNLNRVSTDDGKICWTTIDNIKKMQEQEQEML
jgi:hypothetical protein